jgi:hypothetical protein
VSDRSGTAWRRVLIYTHRWLGIAAGLLFVMWFVSGIVLMYAQMPELSSEDRLARLPPLDWADARLAPFDAAVAAGARPQRARIGMFGDRPVYRLLGGRQWTTVFADTGDRLEGLTPDEAVAVARRFEPDRSSNARHDGHLADADQWTFSVGGLMPMHRIALGDADDTRLYISDQTGEPVMRTTRSGRRWGYLGAVVHWLYFTPLRRHGETWSRTVIWLSIAGCVMTVAGLAWGIWRYSPRRRYRLRRIPSRSPYAGLMWWHHYAGLVFGLAAFTWIFSGLLSMDPWTWSPGTAPTRQQREAVSGGPLELAGVEVETVREAVAALGATPAPAEAEIVQFDSERFLHAPTGLVSLEAVPLRFERFADEAMMAAARKAVPAAPVEDAVWLEAYDAYYYDRRGGLSLPVLRAKFGDPQATWLYLDPRRGEVVRKEERLSRVNRWLYHGLHSLDFPFLYYRRPLWDIVVVVLSLGGLALSATTLTASWHRLRRHARRLSRFWG